MSDQRIASAETITFAVGEHPTGQCSRIALGLGGGEPTQILHSGPEQFLYLADAIADARCHSMRNGDEVP